MEYVRREDCPYQNYEINYILNSVLGQIRVDEFLILLNCTNFSTNTLNNFAFKIALSCEYEIMIWCANNLGHRFSVGYFVEEQQYRYSVVYIENVNDTVLLKIAYPEAELI